VTPRGLRPAMRRLHRWLGISTFAFLLLLSLTGVAINHTDSLGLDEHYVSSQWVLDWYGIEMPQPTASYDSGFGRVTLLGERLYLDDRELARGLGAIAGAVAWDGNLAVATTDSILFFAPAGKLLKRAGLDAATTAIERIGTRPPPAGAAQGTHQLLVEGGERGFLYEPAQTELSAIPLPVDSVQWSVQSVVPPAELQRLARVYRGPGVTLARVLADLHSGRLFSPVGTLVADVVGALIVVLSATGLLVWWRSRRAPIR
jgi:hypothetical protein